MENVFEVAMAVLIALFILSVHYVMFTDVVGGTLYPLIKSLNPNNTQGLSSGQFISVSDHIWLAFKYSFYILFAVLFIYFGMKLLYEREETSTAYTGL